MKSKILLIGLVIFLAGCNFPFNQPSVGPDGTIAFFLNESGEYHLLPEGGVMTLVRAGKEILLKNTATEQQAIAIDWSTDGSEVIYLETEQGELGLPKNWKINLTKPQTNSEVVTLWSSENPVLEPHFTSDNNITYLGGDQEDETVHLFLYDRLEDTHKLLVENVISYRPISSGAKMAIIHTGTEGELSLARVSTYDPATDEMKEMAQFVLTQEMRETLILLPASFLWDVDPSGTQLALTLYDRILIKPEVKGGQPTLYLIESEESTAEEIAPVGIVPAFSPDGKLLAYIGGTGENLQEEVIILYDLEKKEKKPIPDTKGSSSLFWINSDTLGVVFETGDKFSLAKYLIKTEEWKSLSNIPLTQSFEFSSGGAYHPAGHGEWQLKLDALGKLSITHKVGDEEVDYGPLKLTYSENFTIWNLIDSAKIGQIESPSRPGKPDELSYTFTIIEESQTHSVKIRVDEASENDKIIDLIDFISTLIETYTEQKPVLQ